MSIQDGDVLQALVDFAGYGGDSYMNKFTWRWQGTEHPEANTVGSLVQWAEGFYEILDTEMKATVTGFYFAVDKIEWSEGEQEWLVVQNVGATTGSVTLTNASEGLPPQSAPCLVGITARPKSRGRKWIPFFGEDTQDSGEFVSGATTALAAALAEYIDTLVVETGKALVPGVASKVTGEFLPFVTGMITNVVFTQIRRTRGRGA